MEIVNETVINMKYMSFEKWINLLVFMEVINIVKIKYTNKIDFDYSIIDYLIIIYINCS